MLVSSRPRRDMVSVITEAMSRPIAVNGFGLVSKFEQWIAQNRSHAPAHKTDHDAMWPPSKRPTRLTGMEVLFREDTDGEPACASPEDIMQRLCANVPDKESPAWRCKGCNTTDQQCLVIGEDTTMSCSKCSVVVCGVKMVSTHREKACSVEEDSTQHADAFEEKRDFYLGDDVETAEEARSRHAREAGGCCLPTKTLKRNRIGNAHSKLRMIAASEHRAAEEELSKLNCTRNRALQIELVGLCKMVAPVDRSLQRHVRLIAHQLLLRTQLHEAECVSDCGISLSGVSAGLIAKVLMRVMAETLLPLHGKQECPVHFECSREELVGLVDRCNRLVLKEGVHSAMCRTAIDILLNGDYKTPCKLANNAGVDTFSVSLAKNESMEMLSGDAIGAVRDNIWSFSKTNTISDEVRDAALNSLRLELIRNWIVKEAETFTCEIVALRLVRAVNSKMNTTGKQMHSSIVSSMQRACQRSSTSMSSLCTDTHVETIFAAVTFTSAMDTDDDALM